MGLGSGIRDPGSGKKTYSGARIRVKKVPDPGSGSTTLERTNIFAPPPPSGLLICIE
jgi:hypothetical protein